MHNAGKNSVSGSDFFEKKLRLPKKMKIICKCLNIKYYENKNFFLSKSGDGYWQISGRGISGGD
jgi:hypothetical protein